MSQSRDLGVHRACLCKSQLALHHTLTWLDLDHTPYILYGVKFIDIVSRAPFLSQSQLTRQILAAVNILNAEFETCFGPRSHHSVIYYPYHGSFL